MIEFDADQIDRIAEVCHEANRGYQLAFPSPGVPVAMPWRDFDLEYPEQADGVREGVKHALLGASPEELHVRWCEFKLREGWRYGPVKDADAKEHPCLVPYGNLPPEQRRKDQLFQAIVNALV